MRKIVCAVFVSLDGVLQAPGGPDEDKESGFKFGGWMFPHFDEAGGAAIDELFSVPYELLLGRKTYDIFAAYWPLQTDPKSPNNGIAVQFNAVTKYVATHRPESLKWKNSKSLGKDPVASLRELKKGDGPVLLTQGSGDFLQTLFANDLVDELHLMTFPLTLGTGKRLFGSGARPYGFKMTKSTVTPSGVVIARYVRNGEVKTGSFADPAA